MEDASAADNYWDTRCNYPRYTVDEPQSMPPGGDLGSEGLCPPLQNSYDQEVDLEDPSGKPFEIDEDPELRRKREELREIEEQIMRKKVSIALKTVKPLVEETALAGCSSNEQSAACKGASLKDRVNAIIQQRRPVSFLSKVHYRRDEMNPSSLSRDGLLLEDHPLKLRVKALMMQRCRDPHVLPSNTKVPGVAPPPPSRIVTSPAKRENSVDQGFQRFLSVLNKGVDMDLLSRIVNDDSEDLSLGEELLNIQPRAVENKSELPLRGESPPSNSCAFQLGHTRSNSRERKTDLPSEKRYLNDHVPEDDEKNNDGGVLCLGSSSQSKSPPPVKKKRKKKEEDKPNVEKQHADLQNILKTLGFSLEVEEMSRLADRTQERLYGKKHEGLRADSRGEQESQQRDSHGQHRSSSSSSSFSSSTSSSSRSTSRSVSPSPPRHRLSHGRDRKQRRTPEHSSLRERSGDRLAYRESKQDSKEAQKHRGGEDSKETSTYQHPYLQNQMYPHPHSAASSSFPDYSSSQYSQYFDSGTYNAATDSYWTYTQDAIPPSLYPTEHPYPQNTYQHFPTSVSAPTKVPPRQKPLRDVNLLMNPDLSKSEGQTGSTSGPRCLTVVPTKQLTHQICLKQLTRHNTKRKNKSQKNKRRRRKIRAKQRLADSVKKAERPQGVEDDSNSKPEAEQMEEEKKQPAKQSEEEKEEPAEQSVEEKKQPTEEEIKMNLRKKLEAFNQMAKQKLTQSAL